MQGVVIFFMCEISLILGLSLIFCALYVILIHFRHEDDDDTEDDLGYLQYL